MPYSEECHVPKRKEEKENEQDFKQKYEELVSTLPKEKGWFTEHMVKYHGTWFTPKPSLIGLLFVQQHFKPLPTDVLLVTFPKCGTTWFKALIFSIENRSRFEFTKHPLLNSGPHSFFPFLETLIDERNLIPNPYASSSHRLFNTHFPFPLLPSSSDFGRIVYVWRNPEDVFISLWHFENKLRPKELPPLSLSLEQAFESFYQGIVTYGPFWDHVLGYWKASLESPEKVLFLKYEDMKREPFVNVKKLANFLGYPFTLEEDRDGVVQEIIRLCSFENLSNLEVNKTGVQRFTKEFSIENSNFFRKGEIGDWKNYLTFEMKARLDRITQDKFGSFGLN